MEGLEYVKFIVPAFIIVFKIIYIICEGVGGFDSSACYTPQDAPRESSQKKKRKSSLHITTTEYRKGRYFTVNNSEQKKRSRYEDKKVFSNSQSPYDVMGVVRSAEWSKIQQAFRKLAMIHHPDRHVNGNAAEREAAEKNMKIINKAYITLKKRYEKN